MLWILALLGKIAVSAVTFLAILATAMIAMAGLSGVEADYLDGKQVSNDKSGLFVFGVVLYLFVGFPLIVFLCWLWVG